MRSSGVGLVPSNQPPQLKLKQRHQEDQPEGVGEGMDEKQVCRKRTLNTTNSSSTRYGVFPETGFPNDPIYPTLYLKGEQALKTLGCPSFLFCPRSMVGSLAPTKQNQLCRGATALEVIKSKAGVRQGVYNLPQEGKQELTFKYVEAAPPSFVLVLDQSGQMGRVRWASVKKALYRWVLVGLSRFRKMSFQVHWIVARRRHIGNCCLRRNSEPGSSSDHSDRGEEGGLAWQGAKEGPRADAQVTLS